MKLGRNDPCHCGSGQKYKKCHESKDEAAETAKLAADAAARAAAAAAAAEAAAAEGEDGATTAAGKPTFGGGAGRPNAGTRPNTNAPKPGATLRRKHAV
jgi:hypothetical protein